MNELEKKYKDIFINYLNQVIDFEKYDQMIDESNSYFGESNDILHNISSKYLTVLNSIYLDKILEVDDSSIDVEFVKKTYVEALKKIDGETNIMYDPPLLEHIVKDGSLVMEFVYGKNVDVPSDVEYVELMKKQKEVINKVMEEIKKEVKEKLNLECVVFVSKRVRV